MSVGYHINREDGLVTVTGKDSVCLAQAAELGQELLEDPDFDSALPHLVDVRGAQLDPSEADEKSFTAFALEVFSPRVTGSVAVLVDDDLSGRACADIYHLTCRMNNTELFDHYDHALRWLMRREFA